MAALQGVIRCDGDPVFSKSSFTICSNARVRSVCMMVMDACDSGELQLLEGYVKLEMSPLKTN